MPSLSWATYDIPSDRQTTWNAGLDSVGGIPSYTNVTCSAASGNGTTEAGGAIQTCINNASAGTAVYLPPGTYKISQDINMKSNVVLRGGGASYPWLPSSSSGSTVLVIAAGNILRFAGGSKDSNWTPGANSGTSITAGYATGSTSITVSSASGLAVGNYIAIYETDNSSYVNHTGTDGACTWCGEDNGNYHTKQQYVKITGVNGNVLTINRPIYWATPGFSGAAIRKQTFGIQMAGIENLKIQQGGNIGVWMYFCLNCWVKNVETYNAGSYSGAGHVILDFSHACEVRDSYFHHGQSNDSGRNYGVHIRYWNSDHKVENNIVRDTRHSIIFEGGGSGCAILYNYTMDNWESVQGSGATPDTGFLSEDLVTNHGVGEHMNLIEGNYSQNITGDVYWGSSAYTTLFRNYVRGTRDSPASPGQRWAIDVEGWNRYYSIVGNVIGDGWTSGTVLANGSCSPSNPDVYRFGCTGNPGSYSDSNSYSTAILHGNWNRITNGVDVWASSDHAMKNSMYYGTAPSFFSGYAWPPFGSDLSTMVGSLPAKDRYNNVSSGGTTTTWVVTGVSDGHSTNSCVSPVNDGATTTCTNNPNTGYHTTNQSGCGGTYTSGNVLTTGAITSACTVTATNAINTYTVTPAPGTGGSMSPSTPQVVSYGSTTSFTVTADGSHHTTSVTGCSGTYSAPTITTGAITSNCTVTALFTSNTTSYTITPNVVSSGSITTHESVYISSGNTITAPANIVAGNLLIASFWGPTPGTPTTLPSGWIVDAMQNSASGSGGLVVIHKIATGSEPSTYTFVGAGSATALHNLNIIRVDGNATTNTYDVSSSSTYTVAGTTFTFPTVTTSNAGELIYYMGAYLGAATCTWPITEVQDQGIGFSIGAEVQSSSGVSTARQITWSVSNAVKTGIIVAYKSGGGAAHGTISPSSPQIVTSGTTTSFTVTPDSGYYASVSGCGGTLVGNTYTTSAATIDCTVTAVFLTTKRLSAPILTIQ